MQVLTNVFPKSEQEAQALNDGYTQATETLGLRYSSGELIAKNIHIGKKRTSIRLEREMWDALDLIIKKEKVPPANLFEHIDQAKKKNAAFTAALRSWILSYFVRKAGLKV